VIRVSAAQESATRVTEIPQQTNEWKTVGTQSAHSALYEPSCASIDTRLGQYYDDCQYVTEIPLAPRFLSYRHGFLDSRGGL
jgi:hypothetical protein